MPPLRARVNDLAGALPAEHAARLERRLAAYESETSHQIAVLTLDSLEGDALEDFSMRVAEAWKLGGAEHDNGVPVRIVPGDRVARIEVGYGLEGVIPDAITARILREQMIPRFREERTADGIEASVEALMAAGRGERLPVAHHPSRSRPSSQPMALVLALALAALCGVPFQSARRRWLRPVGALLGGGVAGGIAFALVGTILWTVFAFLMGGLVAFRGPALGSLSGFGRVRLGRAGGFSGGFGGGFGGGGGGFGGGGASGRW